MVKPQKLLWFLLSLSCFSCIHCLRVFFLQAGFFMIDFRRFGFSMQLHIPQMCSSACLFLRILRKCAFRPLMVVRNVFTEVSRVVRVISSLRCHLGMSAFLACVSSHLWIYAVLLLTKVSLASQPGATTSSVSGSWLASLNSLIQYLMVFRLQLPLASLLLTASPTRFSVVRWLSMRRRSMILRRDRFAILRRVHI